jgi:hypothetical protein
LRAHPGLFFSTRDQRAAARKLVIRSSRAAADTMRASPSGSTRRLMPHRQHVRLRGRLSALAMPVWPHSQAIEQH